MSIDDFAKKIIEGSGGLNAYQRNEVVVWPYSDRVAASVWTMRCLANPKCEGSDIAIQAILEERAYQKQNAEAHGLAVARTVQPLVGHSESGAE